jgi:tripartite-type tricarboxylate transporter receptor subunit TctC
MKTQRIGSDAMPIQRSLAGRCARLAHAILIITSVAFGVPRARAEEPFYKGKVITIYSYSGAASVYTLHARLLARYMPKYLPGHPTIVVKSMEGAGGLQLTRYLYASAPKDGTEFGTIQRGIPFEPLLGGHTIDFDPLRFTWLGSTSQATIITMAWHTAEVKTLQDLLKTQLLLAGTGAGSDAELINMALNGIFGTKIKIIPGYPNANAAAAAMERGEVEGMNWGWDGLKTSHPDWVTDGKVNILFQGRLVPDPEIPKIPTIYDLAKTDEQRQVLNLLFSRGILGQPFVAPPGLPSERLKQLQQAFADALKDPGLLADAKTARLTIEAVTGDDVARVVREAYATPADVVRRLRAAMGR